MHSFTIPGSRCFVIPTTLLGILTFLCGSPRTQCQTNDKPSSGYQPTVQLRVASNLVVVRVVVRDAKGKPVEGLRKEDFKLFDQGEEQSITQFEVESTVVRPASSVEDRASVPAASPSPTVLPTKYLALYFDTLNTADTDLIQVRDAADRYLSANLQPNERVAVITSEQMLSEFTADAKQIHEALSRLHVSSRAPSQGANCPNLSDYQALEIVQSPNNQNIDAWIAAKDELAQCGVAFQTPLPTSSPGKVGGAGSGGSPSSSGSGGGPAAGNGDIGTSSILNLARNIVNQGQVLAQANLQVLEQVVKNISRMPGERTVILVSPGFISRNEMSHMDRIIDQALRSQVVISSLNPKGLAVLMREGDATQKNMPSSTGGAIRAVHDTDSDREFVATTVLADVARGTGGEFFYNSNDLKAGFGALSGSSVYYILAFAPKDTKPDGKFHTLKVTLAENQKGFRIQARRGYFALKGQEQGELQVKGATYSDTAPQLQDRIQAAVLSKTDVAQLPVELSTKLSESHGETHELSLLTRLDAKSLHFQKEGDHNLNTVTFVFAVFDQKENLIEAQQRRARVNVLDGQLPDLFKLGVYVNLTFQLKPGTYWVREVVVDSEENKMTALSRSVSIP
jgi:VWFA-related protein